MLYYTGSANAKGIINAQSSEPPTCAAPTVTTGFANTRVSLAKFLPAKIFRGPRFWGAPCLRNLTPPENFSPRAGPQTPSSQRGSADLRRAPRNPRRGRLGRARGCGAASPRRPVYIYIYIYIYICI